MPFYIQQRLSNAPQFVSVLYYGAAIVLGLIGLGLGIYWWWADAGAYRWLKDLQLGMIGGFYPTSTTVLSMLAAAALLPVPPMMLMNLLLIAFVPVPSEYRATPPAPGSWQPGPRPGTQEGTGGGRDETQ
jgi:hypothetical protein